MATERGDQCTNPRPSDASPGWSRRLEDHAIAKEIDRGCVGGWDPRSWERKPSPTTWAGFGQQSVKIFAMKLNIFSCDVVGGKEKENGGRTGVQGGGGALGRGARAGSHPRRKDIRASLRRDSQTSVTADVTWSTRPWLTWREINEETRSASGTDHNHPARPAVVSVPQSLRCLGT